MESSLALKLTDLQAEVGHFLGYGRDPAAWSSSQASDVASCVTSGLRNFYFPPPLEGLSHEWSFLKPTASLALASGQTTVPLPDDFGQAEGDLTISGQTSVPVRLTNEGLVRERHAASPSDTGRPRLAAVRPSAAPEPRRGQRFELFVWPTSDAAYTLQLSYHLLPEALTASAPYAYGGAAHAETLLESCLAVAEHRLDDASAVHAMLFQQRLAASIAVDRRSRPPLLGYNGDRSDGRRGWPGWAGRVPGSVTYEGVEY